MDRKIAARVIKSILADRLYAVRQGHIFQISIVRERIISDGCDVLPDYYICHTILELV